MGRITVFTIDNCPLCICVMNALESQKLPYIEISISLYPEKRRDMFQLSSQSSVPQLFFNTRHVGGIKETMQLLKKWKNDTSRYATPLHRYEHEIGRHPDPSKELLKIPRNYQHKSSSSSSSSTSSTTPTKENQQRTSQNNNNTTYTLLYKTTVSKHECIIRTPVGKKVSIMNATEQLKRAIPNNAVEAKQQMYRNVFTEQEACTALMYKHDVPYDQAKDFFNHLRENQIFSRVLFFTKKSQQNNNSKTSPSLSSSASTESTSYYRLQCYETPNILNSYTRHGGIVGGEDQSSTTPSNKKAINTNEDISKCIHHLYQLMGAIETSIADNNGKLNYRAAVTDQHFPLFEHAVCELQSISLGLYCFREDINERNTTAFALNVYNLMLKYAFMKVGIPTTKADRVYFLGNVKFDIGGSLFSFLDWYNGILRANRKSPETKKVQFGISDQRKHFALSHCNHFIHFGVLSRYVNNSPPVRCLSISDNSDSDTSLDIGKGSGHSTLSSSNFNVVDNELHMMLSAFCEDDANIEINSKSYEVILNAIFRTYRADFEHSNDDKLFLSQSICTLLQGTKRRNLEQMLMKGAKEGAKGKAVRITYRNEENWMDRASNFISFHKDTLSANNNMNTINEDDYGNGKNKEKNGTGKKGFAKAIRRLSTRVTGNGSGHKMNNNNINTIANNRKSVTSSSIGRMRGLRRTSMSQMVSRSTNQSIQKKEDVGGDGSSGGSNKTEKGIGRQLRKKASEFRKKRQSQ